MTHSNTSPLGLDPKQHGTPIKARPALIVHGLNLAPERMSACAHIATELGLSTRPLELRGHAPQDTPADFASVSASLWRSQLTAALMPAPGDAPICATLAYSLGALCYLAALAKLGLEQPELYQEPAAHVLLAPAIVARPWSRLLKPLEFWPRLVIPSANPKAYRRHRGTPMAAYRALFDLMDEVRRAALAGFRLHNPVLLAIHPRDELVSPKASESIIRTLCPDPERLTVMHLNNGGGTIRPKFAHLILDPDCLGDDEFRRLAEAIRLVLLRAGERR